MSLLTGEKILCLDGEKMCAIPWSEVQKYYQANNLNSTNHLHEKNKIIFGGHWNFQTRQGNIADRYFIQQQLIKQGYRFTTFANDRVIRSVSKRYIPGINKNNFNKFIEVNNAKDI